MEQKIILKVELQHIYFHKFQMLNQKYISVIEGRMNVHNSRVMQHLDRKLYMFSVTNNVKRLAHDTARRKANQTND